MSRILSFVLGLALAGSAFAQIPNWKADVKAFYTRCGCDGPASNEQAARSLRASVLTPMGGGSAVQAIRQQLVTIVTNTGRFASPGAPVQVRVDIPTSYNSPVRIYGRFQMRQTGGQYRTIDYFIPEGTLFGQYDKLQQTGFVLVNVAMPTSFGDQMLFDIIVTDSNGNLLDQQFTEVSLGGAEIESYYHLDSVYSFAPGLVGFKGRLPVGTPIAIKFGDARDNSSGIIYAQAIDSGNLVVPFTAYSSNYSYAMDAVACVFQQCYTVPNGLVLNQSVPLPPSMP